MTRSQLRGDIIGGVTTFLTLSYIVVVNPAILATQGTGMSASGVLTATVVLAFSMTLLMGLYAKLPFAVAPGMGINAFFTYSLILGKGIPWQTALGMVFWAGVLFLLLSIFPVREAIAKAIPKTLRMASAAGIGLFLTFIGLKNIGLVVSDPVTLVKLGSIGLETGVSLVGLVLVVWLFRRKNPLAMISGVIFVTLTLALFGKINAPAEWFSYPDFKSVFFQLDIMGALKLSLIPAILSILFTDLFDSISTFVGVSHATGLVDQKGEPKNLREGLVVDAIATLGAGLVGTSSGTAYIESSAGIEAGATTGFASVVTAVCFLPFLFLGPWVTLIPAFATAPVLILVGVLLFKTVGELSFDKLEETVPAFLTLVLIPLTFSITQGLLWGFLFHGILFILAGRARELSAMFWSITVLCGMLLVIEQTT